MTPPLLVELSCPQCQQAHWEIDCDFRAAYMAGGRDVGYSERTYTCPHCQNAATGYIVLQKSPSSFFIQPHPMYRMERAEFDHWVAILRQNFPNDPRLKELDRTWYPNTPSFWWKLGQLLKPVYASYPLRLSRRLIEDVRHGVDMHRERSRRRGAVRNK
jgi:hypothetical protein